MEGLTEINQKQRMSSRLSQAILFLTCITLVLSACENAPATLSKQLFKNIPYTEISDVDPNLLSLDIYTPAGFGVYPVIVMIHGGSWSGGDKDTLVVSGTKSQFFTDNDFVFVSINYRLYPEVVFPYPVQDVAAALFWVYTSISDYGGDPRHIYVMGHSAGAQLAALVATDGKYLAAFGLKPNILSGVILLDAAGLDIPGTMSPSLKYMYTTAFTENPETWKKASPINHVAPYQGIPPFLVCYTDQIIPFSQSSQQFAIKLASAGVKVSVFHAVGKTHDSINDDVGIPSDPVTKQIMSFIKLSNVHH